MWEEAKRAGSGAVALDPHSLLGLPTVICSWLNGTGDLDEAKRVLASSPPRKQDGQFLLDWKHGQRQRKSLFEWLVELDERGSAGV